jgi:hypothetical protein
MQAMDTPPPIAGAEQPPARKPPLTSSLAVTILVLVTSVTLATLTLLLFLFARDAITKDGQRLLVVVATVVLAAMAIAGGVIGVMDIIRRWTLKRPAPPPAGAGADGEPMAQGPTGTMA